MNINDKITLNILGREVEGVIKSFRKVNYGDLNINFAILINPSFGRKIPHEYLSTVKFSKIDNFDESVFINKFPNISIIKISDYLKKVTELLKNIFYAVSFVSAITLIVGLMVISSAILVQGKVKVFQNLVFKIIGIQKTKILISSVLEFIVLFISTIMFSTIFGIVISKYIIVNIFMLNWQFDFIMYLYVIVSIFIISFSFMHFTNLKYMYPKVYPLIKNE